MYDPIQRSKDLLAAADAQDQPRPLHRQAERYAELAGVDPEQMSAALQHSDEMRKDYTMGEQQQSEDNWFRRSVEQWQQEPVRRREVTEMATKQNEMSPETAKKWNAWCDGRVNDILDEFEVALKDGLDHLCNEAQAAFDRRDERIEKLEQRLAQLEARLAEPQKLLKFPGERHAS